MTFISTSTYILNQAGRQTDSQTNRSIDRPTDIQPSSRSWTIVYRQKPITLLTAIQQISESYVKFCYFSSFPWSSWLCRMCDYMLLIWWWNTIDDRTKTVLFFFFFSWILTMHECEQRLWLGIWSADMQTYIFITFCSEWSSIDRPLRKKKDKLIIICIASSTAKKKCSSLCHDR